MLNKTYKQITMKTIIKFLIALSLFSQVFLANENIITSAEPIEGSDTANLNLQCNTINENDIISFTIADSLIPEPSNVKKVTVQKEEAKCPFKTTVSWKAGGKYNIFLTKSDGSGTGKQTPKQYVANVIDPDTLTNVQATNPKIGTPVQIQLTFTTKTILENDLVIFAIAAADGTPSSDSKTFSIPNNDIFESGSVTTSQTFTKEGTYKIWLERKGEKEAQKKNIIVAGNASGSINNSAMITSSLPVYFTSATTSSTLKLGVSNLVRQGDLLYFLKSETYTAGATSLAISAPSDSQITGTFQFPLPGLYNIFYQIASETTIQIKQNTQQIVYASTLNPNIITVVYGHDVEANRPAAIKLTYPKNTLYNGDKVIFSLSTGTEISGTATDKTIDLVGVNFELTEHTQTVTFSTQGTYFVWIKRGNEAPIKQTGIQAKIIVDDDDTNDNDNDKDDDDNDGNSGKWISMSLILLIGLFL